MTPHLAPEQELVIGIDLGGTKTLIGLVDPNYTVHYREELATSLIADGDISLLVSGLEAVVKKADRASGEISAIGLGIAGVPDANGVDVAQAPNLGLLPGSAIGRDLAAELGVPVMMENDANLGAMGEQLCGIAQGVSDMVYVSIGTGLGVGLISGGDIIRGSKGAAGEVGGLRSHSVAPAGDSFLTFEEVLAGPNFAKRASTVLGQNLSPADIISLANDGDSHADGLLEEYIDTMAELITILRSIVDPELVVLGGGLGSNDTVLVRVRRALLAMQQEIPIETGSLGHDAALIGARVLCERRETLRSGEK